MRKGDFIGTYSGIHFYPLDPQPEDICIYDIAHALSQICRFNGHTRSMYDVASHSCNVQMLLYEKKYDAEVQLYGLLHDSHEAYIADITRPLANCLSQSAQNELNEMKANVQRAIYKCFGLIEPSTQIEIVIKDADNYVLALEAKELMKGSDGWNLCETTSTDGLRYTKPCTAAEVAFVSKFNLLMEKVKR